MRGSAPWGVKGGRGADYNPQLTSLSRQEAPCWRDRRARFRMILVLISLSSGYVAPHARTQQAAPRACGSRFAHRGAACASAVRVEESVLDDPMFLDEAALLASKGRRRAVRMPRTRRAHSAPCAVRIPYTRRAQALRLRRTI